MPVLTHSYRSGARQHGAASSAQAQGHALSRSVALLAMLIVLGLVDYVIALALGRMPVVMQSLAWLASDDSGFGAHAGTGSLLSLATSAHAPLQPLIAMGAVALGLGVLQLVPALRRSHPRLHRANGLLMWLATGASVAGVMVLLMVTPMGPHGAGAVLQLGLWTLALVTLALLWQAVLAVLAHDYRSHMVWMALVFACLLALPMLRLDWVLGERLTGFNAEAITLAGATVTLLQTLLFMATWLARVGDRDQPVRAIGVAPVHGDTDFAPVMDHADAAGTAYSAWSPGVLLGLGALSALVVAHELLVSLAGVDLLAHWRTDAADRLPLPGVALWAAGSLAVLLQWQRGWHDTLAGRARGRWLTLAGAVSACGAVLIGLSHGQGSVVRMGGAMFWVNYGVLMLALLAMAQVMRPTTGKRNAWGLFWLCLQWLPALLPAFLALGLMLGMRFDAALTMALINGAGVAAVAGLATGYGAQLRGLSRKPALSGVAVV